MEFDDDKGIITQFISFAKYAGVCAASLCVLE
jgi:hypothetical protein